MRYVELGKTGLLVSELGLGTVELGLDYGIPTPDRFGKPTEAEAIRLVHDGLAAGITFIDTPRAYGESEAVLGKALHDRRAEVILATKAEAYLADSTLPTGAELRRPAHDVGDESQRTPLRLRRPLAVAYRRRGDPGRA